MYNKTTFILSIIIITLGVCCAVLAVGYHLSRQAHTSDVRRLNSLSTLQQKNIVSLELQVKELEREQEALQRGQVAEPTPYSNNPEGRTTSTYHINTVDPQVGSLENIQPCPAIYSGAKDGVTLDDEALTTLGIAEYLADGYKIETLCIDEDKYITSILAKYVPNYYMEDANRYMCENSCDHNVFVLYNTLDTQLVTSTYRGLGIYSEAYNAFCDIDGVDSEEGLAVRFYCGTRENNGFFRWERYDMAAGEHELIMRLISLGSDLSDPDDDTYEIYNEQAFDRFVNKSKLDIITTSKSSE